MRLTRVHVDAELRSGLRLTVTGSTGNHIARVLRLRVGDPLTLFNGQGGEYGASVEEIRRDTVLVNVLEGRELERESPFQLVLAQGISRADRMDWVVQKATELGIWRIAPVFTERSVVQLDERQAAKKLQHWRSIAVSACEQSGRNRVPHIEPPAGLYELLEKRTATALPHTTAQLEAMPQATAPALSVLLSPAATRRIADLPAGAMSATVLIGPEGGLTDVEQEAAIRSGFTAVRLGPRVLRTETAAVCALTLLQERFGDV
jgi:16S rRNA (uracil1498-N3)-methyltransferase